METQTPRLIDANVLRKDIEMLRNKSCFDISEDLTSHDTVGFWAGFEYLAKFIESAPTVETTDVANKFFVEFMKSLSPGEQLMSAGTAGRFIEYVQKKETRSIH